MAITLILAVAVIFAMTAAWYSNTIQTTGLIFEVSDWGLNGNVEIGSQFNNAAPGDSGTIPVTVYNSSDGIIDVTFNINKAGLYNDLADMRKRLYFYINDTVTSNNETAERVYINSLEDYNYTVLPKHNLTLEEEGNGATLAWEWVLDVLGYYFYGTVTESSTVKITEYLRPIQYDFDKATFINDKLVTVDGSTSVMNFIKKLSKSDGYLGEVTTSFVTNGGKVFYPVSVDENGTGVWIYCCDLSEIEYENVVDTGLGNATQETSRRFQTTLNVLAEQKKLTVATVDNAEDFISALNDDVHNMIVLSEDITLSQSVNIPANSEKIIDLSDKTISATSSNAINLQKGAAATIMNGTIMGNNANLITAVGADLALSSVTITDVSTAITVSDSSASGQDSRVNMVDCKISCTSHGIMVKGNGGLSKTSTCLNMENCEVISTGDFALVGNGTAGTNGNWGTNITVKNCTLQAKYSGIYHPQKDSILRIEKSTIKGLTPIAVKGGTVEIIDSTLIADNSEGTAEMIQDPVLGKSGYSDTGAGVYVETGYDYNCLVDISGNTQITSYYNDAILLFESTNNKYKISVSGGSYSHDVSAFLADGYVCEKNGERFVVKAK